MIFFFFFCLLCFVIKLAYLCVCEVFQFSLTQWSHCLAFKGFEFYQWLFCNCWKCMIYVLQKKSSNSHTWSAIYTYVNMSRSSHYNYKYKTQKTVLYELMIAKCYNYDLQFNYCYWITIFWTLDFGTSKYGRDHFQFLRLKLVSDLSCFNKKKSFGFPSATNLWNFVLYIIAEAFKGVLPR